MAAQARKRNRYRIAEAKAQMADKVGGATLEIETDDGEVYSIPHPMFYDKATKDALKPLDDDDDDGIAQVLLGDQFDKFIQSGGDTEDIGYVLMQAGLDARDTLAGRKRPTQS